MPEATKNFRLVEENIAKQLARTGWVAPRSAIPRVLGIDPCRYEKIREAGEIPYREIISWAIPAMIDLNSLFVETRQITEGE